MPTLYLVDTKRKSQSFGDWLWYWLPDQVKSENSWLLRVPLS